MKLQPGTHVLLTHIEGDKTDWDLPEDQWMELNNVINDVELTVIEMECDNGDQGYWNVYNPHTGTVFSSVCATQFQIIASPNCIPQ